MPRSCLKCMKMEAVHFWPITSTKIRTGTNFRNVASYHWYEKCKFFYPFHPFGWARKCSILTSLGELFGRKHGPHNWVFACNFSWLQKWKNAHHCLFDLYYLSWGPLPKAKILVVKLSEPEANIHETAMSHQCFISRL